MHCQRILVHRVVARDRAHACKARLICALCNAIKRSKISDMLYAILREKQLRFPLTNFSRRVLSGIVVSVLLASCGNDYNNGCYGCGGVPTELSAGVAAANFTAVNGAGPADVVALSTVQPPVAS